MTIQQKNKLIFILMLFLAFLVYLWFYPLNQGYIRVITGQNNYQITIENQIIECKNDPCSLKFQSGFYAIQIEKKEYKPVTQNIAIKRGKVNNIQIKLAKIMTLKVSDISPTLPSSQSNRPLPSSVNVDHIIAPTWNIDEKKLVYLDQNNKRLKVWSDDKIKIITSLKNIKPPLSFYWSPNEQFILGNNNQDIYFIEINKGSRKKNVLSFNPIAMHWSPDSRYILINNEQNQLFKIELKNPHTTTPLKITLNLAQSVWINEHTILFYAIDQKRKTTIIRTYDFLTQKISTLLTKYNFPINQINYNKDDNLIFLYNAQEKIWYKLEL